MAKEKLLCFLTACYCKRVIKRLTAIASVSVAISGLVTRLLRSAIGALSNDTRLSKLAMTICINIVLFTFVITRAESNGKWASNLSQDMMDMIWQHLNVRLQEGAVYGDDYSDQSFKKNSRLSR